MMKIAMVFVSLLTVLMILMGCSGARYHKTALPDPSSYQAHFPDMDTDGDENVTWSEFNKYYPQATTEVFEALDRNQDKVVDHDEWHQFKKAHGH